MRPLTALSLVCLLALAPAPNPGVVFEIETTDHSSSTPVTHTMSISIEGPNIAIPITKRGQAEGTVIFRGDKGVNGTLVVINHEEQYVTTIDDATVERIGGALADVGSAMEEAMKGLSPEQKKAMEDAMKNLPEDQRKMFEGMQKGEIGGPAMTGVGAKPEIKRTGEKATKSGYPCVKYDVFDNGRKTQELWVTDWKNIEGGGEAKGALARLEKFSEALIDALPKLPGGKDMFDFDFASQRADGFPVVTRRFDAGGKMIEEVWLKSAKRQRIDPSTFEVPKGYKVQKMEM